MDHKEIRKLLTARPFQAFTVHLPEGRSVTVAHHDFAIISPDGRTLLAYETNSACNMIDVDLIASVEVGPPTTAQQVATPTNN